MNLNIPIHLSPTLEKQRSDIEKSFAKAFQRVERFADAHGWKNLTKDPFIKEAHIFDSKPGFDQHIRKLIGQDIGANIPASFSAALEKMNFVSVSSELYLKIFPEGEEADYFEKLIAHEIIHRLHIRILKGDEDAMGPVWFYEGFAIIGASQFQETAPLLSEKEIWTIVNAKDRGSYLKYASVMKYFLKKTGLQEMVEKASDPKFVEWLSSLK